MLNFMISFFEKIICFLGFKKINKNFLIRKPTIQLLNDPTTPRIRIVRKIVPLNFLKFNVKGFNTTGNVLFSQAWRTENVYANINGALRYLKPYFPSNVKKWAAVDVLNIDAGAGEDANAYYDRSNLKFFYFTIDGKVIFTCNSADIVSHELGHAILDAIRPDLWNIAYFEVGAFHEAFGDIISTLTILSYDFCLNKLLINTNNDLTKSNFVVGLAEELGRKLNIGNSLRSALNNFNYVDPTTLPLEGSGLIQQIHSFSQIWAGAFYDLLVEFFNLFGGDRAGLVRARDLSAEFLFHAIQNAPADGRFYRAMANTYISYDLLKYQIHNFLFF